MNNELSEATYDEIKQLWASDILKSIEALCRYGMRLFILTAAINWQQLKKESAGVTAPALSFGVSMIKTNIIFLV